MSVNPAVAVEVEDELDSGYNVLVLARDESEQQEILVNVKALGYRVRVA